MREMHTHSLYISHQISFTIDCIVDELTRNQKCIQNIKQVVDDKNVSLLIFFNHQGISVR